MNNIQIKISFSRFVNWSIKLQRLRFLLLNLVRHFDLNFNQLRIFLVADSAEFNSFKFKIFAINLSSTFEFQFQSIKSLIWLKALMQSEIKFFKFDVFIIDLSCSTSMILLISQSTWLLHMKNSWSIMRIDLMTSLHQLTWSRLIFIISHVLKTSSLILNAI